MLVGVAAIVVVGLLLVLASRFAAPNNSSQRPSSVQANPASMAEIRAITEEARKASLDGDDQKAIRLTAESAKKLEAVAASSSGAEKAVMEYAAALAMEQNQILKKYIDTAGAYADAGGSSFAGLADAEGVRARLALLERAIKAHDAVVDYFQSITTRIPSDLAARGVSQKDANEFAAGFNAKANPDNLLGIHRLEHRILLASKERFELLEASAGLWSVGSAGELTLSDGFPKDSQGALARLGGEIDSLASQQAALIEQRRSGG